MKENPASSMTNVDSLDPNVWGKESYDIATSMVYKGIHEHQPLP